MAVGAVIVVIGLALVGGARPRRDPRRAREASPGRVTMESVVLRERPLQRAAAVRSLERGTRVEVLQDRGGWLEVEPEGGARGFVPTEAVERDRERDAREKRARTVLSFSPVFGVVAQETDVVLAPFPMAPRAGRLHPGEVIAIHGVDHAYFAFRNREGELAFVSSADVDLVPRDPTRPSIVADESRALRKLTVRDLELTGPGLPEELPPSDEAEAEMERFEPEVGEREEGGEVLETATLLSKVRPVYPESARREGIQGSVILEVAIDASGRVTEVAVVRGLPYGLSESAVEAVKHWHYRPARGPAGPVPSRKMVRILYSLEH